MLRTANLIGFVATIDRTRARTFYEDILGLHLVEDTEFALVFDANGTQLRVTMVENFDPLPFTVLGWNVGDIRRAIMDLRAKEVSFERFDGPPQDDDGVCTFPGGAQVAWFKDRDGNLLSLTQFSK